jgi:hypothetical protein
VPPRERPQALMRQRADLVEIADEGQAPRAGRQPESSGVTTLAPAEEEKGDEGQNE